jgi:hypothetical protein
MSIMKVIKAAVDLKIWSLQQVCPNCSSEVEVEAKDIYYDYDSKGNHWKVTCCLCEHSFRVSEKDIPKLVQADTIKKRYVSHPSSDW